MKPRLNPTTINLKDLPLDGRDFAFTSESAELTKSLEGLIGNNPYDVRFRIVPMGNTFDVRGEIKAAMNLQCSLCAIDFKFKVAIPIHELILIQKAFVKGDQQTRTNHAHEWAEGGPNYILLESESFSVPNYVHEAIALAEPIRPVGKPDCDENCENLQDRVQREWLSYGAKDKPGDGIRANPFQVLEKMKLKG